MLNAVSRLAKVSPTMKVRPSGVITQPLEIANRSPPPAFALRRIHDDHRRLDLSLLQKSKPKLPDGHDPADDDHIVAMTGCQVGQVRDQRQAVMSRRAGAIEHEIQQPIGSQPKPTAAAALWRSVRSLPSSVTVATLRVHVRRTTLAVVPAWRLV
jgi:hypothetical protein